MSLRMRFTLLGVALLSLPRVANADPDPPSAAVPPVVDDSPMARVQEGTRLYHEQRYAAALEHFEAAYAAGQDSNLLFNMARCFEALGKRDEAVAKYQAYLESADAEPEGIERAERALAKLERAAARVNETASDSGATERRAQPGQPAARQDQDVSPEAPSSVPYWLLGGAVVVLGAGSTLYVLGMNDHKDVTGARGYSNAEAPYELSRSEARALVDSGDTKKGVGVVLASVGGALALTSLTVLLFRPSEPAPGMDTRVSLVPRDGGAALQLSGAFQ